MAEEPTTGPKSPHRVVIVGGGFGGVYTAHALQKLTAATPLDITLVSRENYFLITPLLFEAGSGVLDPRHVVSPIRPLLTTTHFIEAQVTGVDMDRRVVNASHEGDPRSHEIPYDTLVLAVGGVTNRSIIPGSEQALAFKTLADAIFLRNQVIDLFEQADVETDPARKQRLLTFVLIGAGLVGVELAGELTEFLHNICRSYRHVRYEELRMIMLEAGPRFLPEMAEDLANFAHKTLAQRRMDIRVNTKVAKIDPGSVTLGEGENIAAHTIILCAGIGAHPLLEKLPLEKQRGRIVVEPTMRVKDHPEIWALGDCAFIPDSVGKPYPQLAQHALREARLLAANIVAAGKGEAPAPFVYQSMGTMAALGHFSGIGRVMKVQIRGFVAWWVWRTYYLMQMPGWSRRLRIVIDWTIALFFHNDIVKLDLYGLEHPLRAQKTPAERPGPPTP